VVLPQGWKWPQIKILRIIPMKKWFMQIAVLMSVVVSSAAFSLTDLKQLHTSSTSFSVKQGIKRFSLMPTDVIVINLSNDLIFASVPGTNIDMPVEPGYYSSLISDTPLYFTLNIEDDYHFAYWSRQVCPRAIIEVVGPFSSDVRVISDHC
jgi:hypothetical protein